MQTEFDTKLGRMLNWQFLNRSINRNYVSTEDLEAIAIGLGTCLMSMAEHKLPDNLEITKTKTLGEIRKMCREAMDYYGLSPSSLN